MEKVTLHRCPFLFLKMDSHACHRVQKALDEQGIEYELVKAPALPKGRRTRVLEVSGQSTLPTIEFADGSGYRAESKDMAAEIAAGRLFEHKGDVPGRAAGVGGAAT